MLIKQINVFTKEINKGNPAAVVIDFAENSAQMQLVAKKLNMPATIFILSAQSKLNAANLRFFAPNEEYAMCGHGILAAASYLLTNTLEGELSVEIPQTKTITVRKKRNGILQFDAEKAKIVDTFFDKKEIGKFLGLSTIDLKEELPFCFTSIGSTKLLVPVKSRNILMSLHPNFAAIESWSKHLKVNGLYVYTDDTIEKISQFHARNFNPRTGSDEDAATGVAAAALASVYADKNKCMGNIIIEQGDCMNRASRIIITVEKNKLKIGGYATTIKE